MALNSSACLYPLSFWYQMYFVLYDHSFTIGWNPDFIVIHVSSWCPTAATGLESESLVFISTSKGKESVHKNRKSSCWLSLTGEKGSTADFSQLQWNPCINNLTPGSLYSFHERSSYPILNFELFRKNYSIMKSEESRSQSKHVHKIWSGFRLVEF